jgi:hypothetical protein
MAKILNAENRRVKVSLSGLRGRRAQSHFIRLTVQEYGYTCIFEICGIGEWRLSCEQGEHGSAESAKICEQKRPVESAKEAAPY